VSGCREALFESYVNMLHQHCDESPGTYSVLQEVLQRSIKEFPNNMYLLTTSAKLQVRTALFCTQIFFYITDIVEGRGQNSSVGIVTGYRMDGPGIESRWGEIFCTCPDRPWGPPSLLYNGYRVFLRGKAAGAWC
jgi:hypothetical protein